MNDVQWFVVSNKLPILFIAAFVCHHSLRRWRWATALYGEIPVKFGLRVLWWTMKTRKAWLFAFVIFSILISMVVSGWMKLIPHGWLLGVFPVTLFLCSQIILFSTPPSILLLGTSNTGTAELLALLHTLCSKYRAVALLHYESSVDMSWFDRVNFNGNNLRIVGNHDWREVVFPLADKVPIIILDTRMHNSSVEEESVRILAEERLFAKTIFLTCDDGSSASLELLGGQTVIPRSAGKCDLSNLVQELKLRIIMRLNRQKGAGNNS